MEQHRRIILKTLFGVLLLLSLSIDANASSKELQCPFNKSDGGSGVLWIWIDDASDVAEVLRQPDDQGQRSLYKKEVLPSLIRLSETSRMNLLVVVKVLEIDRETLTVRARTLLPSVSEAATVEDYSAICTMRIVDDTKNKL